MINHLWDSHSESIFILYLGICNFYIDSRDNNCSSSRDDPKEVSIYIFSLLFILKIRYPSYPTKTIVFTPWIRVLIQVLSFFVFFDVVLSLSFFSSFMSKDINHHYNTPYWSWLISFLKFYSFFLFFDVFFIVSFSHW